MRIIQITPGTGSFYCGTCLRDNALVAELRRQGHDALMVPLYLPLALDEAPTAGDAPLFYGGVNVYLQQKSALFRKTPAVAGSAVRRARYPAVWRRAGRARPRRSELAI